MPRPTSTDILVIVVQLSTLLVVNPWHALLSLILGVTNGSMPRAGKTDRNASRHTLSYRLRNVPVNFGQLLPVPHSMSA
jgi:hypothetical protein